MNAQELQIFNEYAAHPTIELRNEIVEKNLYMVDILIRKYLGKGVDYDDLYQVGAIALVNAVERFDPTKGFEFRSFATPTILGEIKKYFRDKEWSLKVPRRMKEIAGKVDIPLVLHGGSNNPDKEIGESVTLGISKINISSDIKVAYFEKMREVLQDKGLREPNEIEPPCIEAMKVVAKHKLDLFQTTGKAVLYK